MTSNAEPSSALHVLPEPPVDSVEGEQLRMLFEHMAVGMLLATAFAMLLAAQLNGVISAGLLLTWVGLKLGVVLPRAVQIALYRRRRVSDPRRWMLIANALLVLDGFIWGLGGLWFTQAPMAQAAIVAASLCCVACVATFGLQVSVKATAAYVVPMMTFTAAGMLVRGNEVGLVPAAGLLLVLVLMLSTAWRAERRLLEVFRLRLLAQQIAAERGRAVLVLEGHNERKSRFIATVSHEIRSPLHGMISMVELLDREIADEPIRQKLALIALTGQHVLTIVNDLLDMAKIEAGSLRLDLKVFDLSNELAQMSALYRMRAQEVGIFLDTRVAIPAPLQVVGDSGRVRQVLDNLVGNALKFTPRGGSVTLAVTLMAERGVEFVVTDSGAGISKSDQARLFRPFEQGSAEPDKAREGAGLGLAIAHDLVALMRGSLICKSDLGQGSSFSCLLPLPLAYPPAALPAPDHAAKREASPLGFGSDVAQQIDPFGMVLVVDDDEVSALVAMAALQQAGCVVEVVRDGHTALQRMTSVVIGDRPWLAIMDCDLPRLDGLEATRQVRSWEKRTGARPMRIVALTGRARPEDRVECLKVGMDEVFTKPFSMAALAEAVTRHANDFGDKGRPNKSLAGMRAHRV